ncbi:MFS transporter [Streptomyces spirodelae]|uniref:MFS transporter n=1 Tax=Streptomyces spirodelae TaxID=2812904 RepID=A0ABS3WWN5_9ACTN|nr:MFS transporter [Streptomyces spirodelae]MBO8187529.1 MFS transporter [Streptomyces spirodelae]
MADTRAASPPGIGIDEVPFRKVHLLAAVCTLGGAALDGYILGIIGHAIGPAADELHLGALGQGLIAASALTGIFVAGLCFGRVADRYGRKKVFLWNLIAFAALSLAQLFVVGMWDLVAVRVLLGLAIGVEYAVGAALLAEFSTRRHRGPLLGSIELAWIVGFVAAFVVGSLYQGDNWRLLLASSALPALVVLLLRTRLPESPRWLQAKGRHDEAAAIVARHFGDDVSLPDPAAIEAGTTRLSTLFTARTWRRTVYSGLFWFCQVAPFFAIFTFVVPIAEGLGIADGHAADLWVNALQLIGAVLGLWLLHKLTRRSFVISTFAFMTVGLVLIGVWPHAPLPVLVVAFGLFTLVATAASDIQFVYPSEIFETRVRSTGVGFSAAVSRISAALATYLLPLSLQHVGVGGTMLIAAVFPLVGTVASLAWAPETKGVALD